MRKTIEQFSAILLLLTSSIHLSCASIGGWEACGGRLERALDALQRDSARRRIDRYDDDVVGTGIVYQQPLRSAPLDMTVSRTVVKLPYDLRVRGTPWAQVERCVFEPSSNSLQSRVQFNDLSVSGLVSLLPRDYRAPFPAESCRMTLRLRRAGIEFYTSPISRGRGQMRIRTESSFMEPRFASIYAYGCRPTRFGKQIRRQDKWPPQQDPQAPQGNAQHVDQGDEVMVHGASYRLPPVANIPKDTYEAAEPRELATNAKEEDVAIPNENRQVRALFTPEARLGVWRKSAWITKPSSRRRRSHRAASWNAEVADEVGDPARRRRSTEDITPQDFAMALAMKARSLIAANDQKPTPASNDTAANLTAVARDDAARNLDEQDVVVVVDGSLHEGPESKSNFKRETTQAPPVSESPEEIREMLLEEDIDELSLIDLESESRGWQSRDGVAREMEDVFLRGASQALTNYIEQQLHPAIKETLMLSMGYTISYG